MSGTHMLLRAGEGRPRSGPAHSRGSSLKTASLPLLYIYHLYYESTLPDQAVGLSSTPPARRENLPWNVIANICSFVLGLLWSCCIYKCVL